MDEVNQKLDRIIELLESIKANQPTLVYRGIEIKVDPKDIYGLKPSEYRGPLLPGRAYDASD